MNLLVRPSSLSGEVTIPPSKSHTIRAVVISTLAEGTSEIINPLISRDTMASVRACESFGADFSLDDVWVVNGVGGGLTCPDNIIDVENSGTTLYVMLSVASLFKGYSIITGDEQTRRRSAQPLINALESLGARIISTRGDGRAPFVVEGRIRGGSAKLDGSKTSQYLTSLLLSCPLSDGNSEIEVFNLVEKPYIRMTMDWLDLQGINYSNDNLCRFFIKGGQHYSSYRRKIPGDFSSGTFFLCAGAIKGSELTIAGLDMNDSQGDRVVVSMLKEMGADITTGGDKIVVKGGDLKGMEFDMCDTPDALPAMAVLACFAKGKTSLRNASQVRLKETDRITIMKEELSKMGASISELPDGLIIEGTSLKGAVLNGHGDHRVVMALAVAGLGAEGRSVISSAESVEVTFPNFVDLMVSAGAEMRVC